MVFADRVDAGRRLAAVLSDLRGGDVVVLGLPRGGVPVAAEVAAALGLPLDVIVVRKLGVPSQPELAMGAIGEGDVMVLNDEIIELTGVSEQQLEAVERRERDELARRVHRFRGDGHRLDLAGRTALVVDDGVATGSTARAACRVARAQGAAQVILAVPVAPAGWVPAPGEVDRFVCIDAPDTFRAVGQFYADFSPTTDDEVVACLRRAPVPAAVGDGPGSARDEEVEVLTGTVALGGHLTMPPRPIGMVVFAHGSGSSRHSPRNAFVAGVLQRSGLGTLLFDLLTEDEERDRANVFDVELLGSRLLQVTSWLRAQPGVGDAPVGYFGASTGAAAALWAAAEPDAEIVAVVSRGGRPDLAGERLAEVRAPTLLVVGGLDDVVLDLNRRALARLHCEKELVVVPGATHLFEERGTLREAAEAARDWFVEHCVEP